MNDYNEFFIKFHNHADLHGFTALDYAVRGGFGNVIERLRSNTRESADVPEDEEEKSPLEIRKVFYLFVYFYSLSF